MYDWHSLNRHAIVLTKKSGLVQETWNSKVYLFIEMDSLKMWEPADTDRVVSGRGISDEVLLVLFLNQRR